MLLQEKMKEDIFSPSEKEVVEFILNKQNQIEDYSITQIAGETYTSPSILVRISKKLGFSGFTEFKKCFLDEVKYTNLFFENMNANLPFEENDTGLIVSKKIAQIRKESIDDTLAMLKLKDLEEAIALMKNSRTIKVFTISNLTFQAEEFVFKLRHIGKRAETYSTSNTMIQEAFMTSKKDCAICISYSGESEPLLSVAKSLSTNNIPIVSITGLGNNTLSTLSTVSLSVTTKEKSFSKVAAFTSLESISFLLDVLYSNYFNTNFKQHYYFKTQLSRLTESRLIDHPVIKD